ncbi:hypothetical protein SUGI_0290550 [Cryptomeria japonica]|uniref:chaperone protein dnaJ 8, chloroplastic n=1 Tax=Cryptomeria japonica TaxID=3369 RepID=UPI002408C3BF|nr:chaperone protein dnaJ 8, chloroplastic [Cryptomeria japonica]GLJ16858.1 hypothetical protein SUGI_0290550 [Cryptomeria japonica]
MAVTVGRIVGAKGNSNPLFRRKNGDLWHRRNVNVRAMASVTYGRLKEEYKLLSLKPNATENEVKKAYRRLALQYHPDVCKGDNCGVRFYKITEAYQSVMSTLAEATEEEEYYADDDYMGHDQWEEWMGFEGGMPSRDYSNHINYYA